MEGAPGENEPRAEEPTAKSGFMRGIPVLATLLACFAVAAAAGGSADEAAATAMRVDAPPSNEHDGARAGGDANAGPSAHGAPRATTPLSISADPLLAPATMLVLGLIAGEAGQDLLGPLGPTGRSGSTERAHPRPKKASGAAHGAVGRAVRAGSVRRLGGPRTRHAPRAHPPGVLSLLSASGTGPSKTGTELGDFAESLTCENQKRKLIAYQKGSVFCLFTLLAFCIFEIVFILTQEIKHHGHDPRYTILLVTNGAGLVILLTAIVNQFLIWYGSKMDWTETAEKYLLFARVILAGTEQVLVAGLQAEDSIINLLLHIHGHHDDGQQGHGSQNPEQQNPEIPAQLRDSEEGESQVADEERVSNDIDSTTALLQLEGGGKYDKLHEDHYWKAGLFIVVHALKSLVNSLDLFFIGGELMVTLNGDCGTSEEGSGEDTGGGTGEDTGGGTGEDTGGGKGFLGEADNGGDKRHEGTSSDGASSADVSADTHTLQQEGEQEGPSNPEHYSNGNAHASSAPADAPSATAASAAAAGAAAASPSPDPPAAGADADALPAALLAYRARVM